MYYYFKPEHKTYLLKLLNVIESSFVEYIELEVLLYWYLREKSFGGLKFFKPAICIATGTQTLPEKIYFSTI